MSKPVNKNGMWCPLWRAKTEKSCHTCQFWSPLRRIRRGEETVEYECAIVAQLELQSITVVRLDEMTKANHESRNAFIDFKKSILKLVSMLYTLRPHAEQITARSIEDKSDGKG